MKLKVKIVASDFFFNSLKFSLNMDGPRNYAQNSH